MRPLDYLKAATYNYVSGPLLQKTTMWDLPSADELVGDASGLTAIVTGPTSGIGEATTGVLARNGAHGAGANGRDAPGLVAPAFVLACRSQSKGDALAARLASEARAAGRPAPSLEIMLLDLNSLESVRAFVAAWEARGRPLHLLINNAGLFHMGAGRSTTKDGLEAHMGTNHLAHFLLTLGLLPALRRGAATDAGLRRLGGARVVHVASSMLMFGRGLACDDPTMELPGSYSAEVAYGRSKLAQVLFARELRRRLAEQAGDAQDPAAAAPPNKAGGVEGAPRVQAYAVHPGYVLTDVVRSLPAVVQRAYRLLMARILLTPEQGSRATLKAACSPTAWRDSLPTGGFFNCDAKPAVLSDTVLDDKTAAWLWDWSARQVKLPADWDLPARRGAS
ncbi:hypothetical protein MNEG_5614 [Monoraphidium neglectum]|uniref:Retinol dehydrogenase 12 n=1 Tax=Monoraphidium neglectum TaxID=145388 RepID=A0A0D2L5P4_9CHLO|nr:hypothetical protein MNEG_5614 [Monoraphidium neglectum]KIZ02344.1 hypothetical protein MNEG_5614 [Monoraphidium neglectum]|eukprot:XP_013901363.1 hypothetical protein MNEG_5614 [Monoraphidium neglectum]